VTNKRAECNTSSAHTLTAIGRQTSDYARARAAGAFRYAETAVAMYVILVTFERLYK